MRYCRISGGAEIKSGMPELYRGEVERQTRKVLGFKTQVLGDLVGFEMGRIEGKGEVRDFVDHDECA